MTREEIIKHYKVNEYGIVERPGKFEGEMLYIPYFYGIYLDGWHNVLQDGSISIPIEKREKEMFPELGKRKKVVRFNIDEEGFVWESR